MGADFVHMLLPLCDLTPERKQKLTDAILALEAGEEQLDQHGTVEEWREHLQNLVKKYPFEDREVGHLQTSEHGPRFLITGGMSWGDPPTEAYDMLWDLNPFYPLLLKWAEEDAPKPEGLLNKVGLHSKNPA